MILAYPQRTVDSFLESCHNKAILLHEGVHFLGRATGRYHT